jgi:hypothetical protein
MKIKEDSFDLGEEVLSKKAWKPEKEPCHPDKAKMKLAYVVLGGIFTFFIITLICSSLAKLGYFDFAVSNSLFEIFKTGLLPIVTLILGYYFSKNG